MAKVKTYERLIIETNDRWLYQLFGLDSGLDDAKPMVITREGIDCLEDYLLDYDESDEYDEPKMNDKDNKEMFDTIKKYLKKYKEVQVVYKVKE